MAKQIYDSRKGVKQKNVVTAKKKNKPKNEPTIMPRKKKSIKLRKACMLLDWHKLANAQYE